LSETKVRNRKPQQIAFLIALIGIPALILWIYFAPGQQGEPTFEKLQSQSQQEEKSPLEVMEDMWEHHPGHGPIALELANLYLADGQYRKALEFYNIFLEDDTSATGWEVRLDMSRAYAGLMRPDSAILELNIILEHDPDHAGALYNLGAIQANAGRFSDARAAWEKLIAKHPQDTLAQFAQASLPKLNKPDGHP
jgi:tetratricopeptide (TPR) repeat protein